MRDECGIVSGVRVECVVSGLVGGYPSADGSARSRNASQWKRALSWFVGTPVVCPRTYVVILWKYVYHTSAR